LRTPFTPSPERGWRIEPREIEDNTEFIIRCLRLWDAGHDTKDIADLTFQWEYVVERTVRLGRERRRGRRDDHAEEKDRR
jgi:hypothetical protein